MGGKQVSIQGLVISGSDTVSYLSQNEAIQIDEMLMGPLGFNVDQLMELAGLSVAASIAEVYKPVEHSRVLAICGPGNNGGDGLVAARHLYHFGYKPRICYPKRTPKPLYSRLVTQLESLSVPFLSVEDLPSDLADEFDIIVDAIFGFSFRGTARPPFDDLIERLACAVKRRNNGKPAIVSVDIPSGWHVEEGAVEGIHPDMLVSLTAPKMCARKFNGRHHFLGGRFVPPTLISELRLNLPRYGGTLMCVRIGGVDISGLRESYDSPELVEESMEADPLRQFRRWLNDAITSGLSEPNAMALSTCGKSAKPSCRMVLLKGVDRDGFVWYTNYESRKGDELSENPHASLLFYWNELKRQVRVEGKVEKVSGSQSEGYFHSRPRGSQIGAVASKQGKIVVGGRQVLDDQYRKLEDMFSRDDDNKGLIPKPACWGGYRLNPLLYEFWQGQPSRMHDRLQYALESNDGKLVWRLRRLYP